MTSRTDRIALWMSHPQVPYLEIAHAMGFRRLVIDIEHGAFDLAALDHFLALARALGVHVLAKTLAPTTEAVQQPLDFGADGVVIPHLVGVEHARGVAAAGKFPPLGTRSYCGGRPTGYTRATGSYFEETNQRVRTYAMIETAGSLEDVERIAALETVDGLFPGPSDLALSRGRGAYEFGPQDREDLRRIAKAARDAGKPWIMSGWTPAERAFALEEQADLILVATQTMVVRAGLGSVLDALARESVIA
jgi:4-hydroxy-2-oxoheptanedioate aldolase